jgi:hypothetical protein
MSKISELTKRAIELDKERAQITREIKKEALRVEREQEKQMKRKSPPKRAPRRKFLEEEDDIEVPKMKKTSTQPAIKRRRVVHDD